MEDGLGLGSGLSAAARCSISVRIYHAVRHSRRTTTIDEAERDVAHDTTDLGTTIVVSRKAGVRVRSRHTGYIRLNTLVQGCVDLQHNAHFRDNGCCFGPLLTLFRHLFALRRPRDRKPLFLGLCS